MFELTLADGSVFYTDKGVSFKELTSIIEEYNKPFRLIDYNSELNDCYCFPQEEEHWIYLYKCESQKPTTYLVDYLVLSCTMRKPAKDRILARFKAIFSEIVPSDILEIIK